VAPVLGSFDVTLRGVKESGEIFLPVMVTKLAGEKLNIPVAPEFCGAAVIIVCCGPDESTKINNKSLATGTDVYGPLTMVKAITQRGPSKGPEKSSQVAKNSR